MNNRAAATERSPLNGSAPVASVPARSRTRVQSQWAKVGLSVALAVALVLAIFLSSRPATSRPHEAASTTATTATSDGDAATVAGGSAAPAPLMNGSEPWSCGSSPYETGYVTLANKKDDHYFYWFVESSSGNPSTDPLVLWLTGGPGGSSMLALLTENGPCSVNEDGETTTPNAYAWNHAANVIWLDQPTGVGFSYSNAPQDDADRDEQNVGENIYWFLQGFLNKHPEFDGRAFFITGESYGGHYVPGAAHYIWLENQKSGVSQEPRRHINLQGIAIGNGHTDPVIQYQYNAEMARGNSYNVSLLSDAEVAQMREDSKQCIAWTEQCQRAPAEGSACVDAVACWSNKLIAPYSAAQRNSYDLRKTCTQPTGLGVVSVCGADFSSVARYLDRRAVREALGVAPSVGNWTAFNLDVMATFVGSGDFSFSYSAYVADLLDSGVRVLIYAGDADLACNWLGNRAWTLALPWSGHDAFNAAEERAFVTQDPLARADAAAVSVDAGVVRAYANFAFLRVYEAGHMVPTDQPAVALAMLQRFLRNEPF